MYERVVWRAQTSGWRAKGCDGGARGCNGGARGHKLQWGGVRGHNGWAQESAAGGHERAQPGDMEGGRTGGDATRTG